MLAIILKYFFLLAVQVYMYFLLLIVAPENKRRARGKKRKHVERGGAEEQKRTRERLSRCHGDEQSDSDAPPPLVTLHLPFISVVTLIERVSIR
jgi:hypothetical protein